MSNTIVNFALRGAQAVFAAVVLGISVTLCKNQVIDGTLPATLGYVAFVGGISLVAAFVGIASTWVELLQGIIGAGIDAVILLLNLAGGILIAIKLKGADCSNTDIIYQFNKLRTIDVINGGCVTAKTSTGDKDTVCGFDDDYAKYNSRCKQNQADSAFMFLTVVILLAAVTLTLLHAKRR